uniref:Endoplasmic reticulum-Golgi intermediate compartment protein 3 n=1 Tax=Strigamia maritima TaxID=126957 RepID=T1JD18_STRMM
MPSGDGLLERIRQFDAYPKTLDDFRIKTFCGATVTIISAFLMISLLISELNYYLTTELQEELLVDTSRGQKLRINIDVIFHRVSCGFLSIDAIDVSGAQQLNVDHNIYKRRLNLEGKPIKDPEREESLGVTSEFKDAVIPNATNETTCGSCYGAEGPDRKCCNTCDDIQEAYRIKGWGIQKLELFEQCKLVSLVQKLLFKENESCQVFGYLDVNRFNLTHTIRHLSFGTKIPGKNNPLDGTYSLSEEGAMMYQYYVKIVPTTYIRKDGYTLKTNQFSVTRHVKNILTSVSDQGLPGVFIIYELSPLMVKYTEKTKSFTHFLTGVCAIIGGVFTVAGLIDAFLYHSSRAIQRKIDLGKAS